MTLVRPVWAPRRRRRRSLLPDMAPSDYDRFLPEQRARVRIDSMLMAVGWVVQNYRAVNLCAGTGVAVW